MDDLVNPLQQRVGALAVVQRAQPEWIGEASPRIAGLLGSVSQAQLAAILCRDTETTLTSVLDQWSNALEIDLQWLGVVRNVQPIPQ